MNWWLARLPDAGIEEIYADGPDIPMASAFQTPLQAKTVDGGFLFTGRSALASYVHEARWVLLTAVVDGGPDVRTPIANAMSVAIGTPHPRSAFSKPPAMPM